MAAGSPDRGAKAAAAEIGAAATTAWTFSGRRAAIRLPRFAAIWIATALLFAISPLLAPGSDSHSALLSTLPFAAILAIAAIGQTLVIQQRGLDLSVAGMITLTTIIVTKVPAGRDSGLLPAIGLVLLACVASGLVSGFAITRLGITPLVATLGVNALLTGVVLQITSGAATASATPGLARFALDRTLGIPNTVVVAVLVCVALAALMRTSVFGRRFVAVGTSPRAAHAAGIAVPRYQVATYVVASLAYGLAGVFAAGFLGTPGIATGDNYLLPTIAAVVLGGTALAGGSGSVAATMVGALFLTQLEQVVLGMGAPDSVQLVIQGSIIALGMALRQVPVRRLAGLAGPRRDGAHPDLPTILELPSPAAQDPVPRSEPSHRQPGSGGIT